MKYNKCQTEWERAINLMTDEELQFINTGGLSRCVTLCQKSSFVLFRI